jgi:hypothetical protein
VEGVSATLEKAGVSDAFKGARSANRGPGF